MSHIILIIVMANLFQQIALSQHFSLNLQLYNSLIFFFNPDWPR